MQPNSESEILPNRQPVPSLVQSSAMANLTSVLNQLEQERTRLSSQLERVTDALSALDTKALSRRGRMSAAGRARIAAAQRAPLG